MEEDEAEKLRQSAQLDHRTGRLSPLSPGAPSQGTPLLCRPEVLLKSDLWDTVCTELPDSPSGTGSSAVQFSLEHETLPEMLSCDSLLSLDDEDVDVKMEELLVPSVFTAGPRLALTEQTSDGRKRTPECRPSARSFPGLDTDWLMEPAAPEEASDKLFSLDLDRLGSPSPPKEGYSLPKLITFSPVDDMKC